MLSEGKERVKGVVLEAYPEGKFKVRLEDGKEMIAYLAGKMRIYKIKVLPGDKVLIERYNYDQEKGRIIRRL